MTRRERLERKLEKRQQWAESRSVDATQRFAAAHAATEHIPMGQPILIGHHSESRHRAALARSDRNMRAGCESADMAKHHESKADGIERQLDNSVFSDDADAIEQLQARIAEREAERDKMKLVNKLWKKGDASGLAELGIDLEKLKAKLADAGAYWGSAPHLPYSFSNLGANIRRDKQRIEEIKRRQQRSALAEQSGGVVIEGAVPGQWCRVTFAEKPAREVLNALREAGFRWGAGSWCGPTDSLPECVTNLKGE